MENTEKNQNPLATEEEGRLIAKFAIPAIISMLVSSLYNIVDQIFIGQGVGMLGNAATNIAFPISIICTATALLLGIGSASNFNLESGAGRREDACRVIGTGLSLLVICGMIIAVCVLLFLNPLLHVFGVTENVLPYAQDYARITALGIPFLILTTGGNHMIRADRSPTYSMVCMLTGAVINTILDPTFIFVFHWGIKGAAWATVIGQIISGVMVIVYFLRFRKMDLKKEMLRPRLKRFKMIASLGMASCINQIAMAVVQITMNNTLRHYGAASAYGADIPLACVGVISKVNMVFMAIAIGISQGCQPIWGFNYGAGLYHRVRKTYTTAFQYAFLVGVVFFLGFQFFPEQIVGIFGTGSKEYFQFASRYFRIFMFMTFLNGIQPMSSGFFTSIGKAKLGIVVSLTRQVIFLLPLVLIFPAFMGIDGVMYAGPIADGAAAVVAIGYAVRELRVMKRLEKNAIARDR
ncbi:MATE family efflux transporter [Faecalicatena contorta]|uniref:MATE family efflux transporter n=1 Tax=Faecalicatena contorta TaxID=39482 RepID=UPI001F3D2C2A|nr:MATE family efflux transporter [Faecalicatena contorta]MCF2681560.1 MATE family efflux transporter [Faecalicatena contorta]